MPPILRWAYRIGILLVIGTFASDIWLDVDYEHLANLALAVAAIGVDGFTGLYGFRSKWKSNRIGGVYLIKCIAMSAFLVQAALSVWWPWWANECPFRQQIRFVIYSSTALVYIPMIITLWREQQHDRDEGEVTGPPVPF